MLWGIPGPRQVTVAMGTSVSPFQQAYSSCMEEAATETAVA